MQNKHIKILTLSPGRSIYYYNGNIFQPQSLYGSEPGRIKKAIRKFEKENAELIKKDRSDPEYKTLVQLFDEQMEEIK